MELLEISGVKRQVMSEQCPDDCQTRLRELEDCHSRAKAAADAALQRIASIDAIIKAHRHKTRARKRELMAAQDELALALVETVAQPGKLASHLHRIEALHTLLALAPLTERKLSARQQQALIESDSRHQEIEQLRQRIEPLRYELKATYRLPENPELPLHTEIR